MTTEQQAHLALLDWLNQPQSYPHAVTAVRKIETHISAVFLTGDFAYKLKKPVNFGFLDFSQLAQRHQFCQMELQLNRRTAPQLYLDVVPIYQSKTAPQQISFSPQPGLVVCDYLVKMRQFDPDQVLSRYIKRQDLSDQQADALAHAIAELHHIAEPIQAGHFLGSPQCVLEPMTDNFPSLFALLQEPSLIISKPDIDLVSLKNRLNQLKLWTCNQHALLAPMIEQRQAEGHVRACHGDLHLDNITLLDDKPLLFDGIEFNDQFRWIDTLSDLAFLLIDLDYRQKPALAAHILNRYLQLTGDYSGLVLLRFYQTYRALVRAKITGLRYLQLDPDSETANAALASLLSYIELAENYAYLTHTQPTLFIMQGVSGSGKSYYANQIHQQTGAVIVSSDRERKRLFGIEPATRLNPAQRKKLYSNEMNGATYQRLYQACQSALQAGINVVADATFLQAKHRESFIQLAQNMQVNYLVVAIKPDPQQAEALINARIKQNTDPSDADARVMRYQLDQYEAPLDHERALELNMKSAMPSLKKWLDPSLN